MAPVTSMRYEQTIQWLGTGFLDSIMISALATRILCQTGKSIEMESKETESRTLQDAENLLVALKNLENLSTCQYTGFSFTEHLRIFENGSRQCSGLGCPGQGPGVLPWNLTLADHSQMV